MTPAERALLVAIARVVSEGHGRLRLLAMIQAVEREDSCRAYADRMPVAAPEKGEQ